MANKKKSRPFVSGEDIIDIISERRNFAKVDVREFMDELKNVFEECISKDIDIDIKGLIHVFIKDMVYKKPTGIVKYHGATKDFNAKTKRVVYQVPKNFKELIKRKEE